ncbi:MAG TPA: homoserine dehydrogenase [Candidatus Acidoferrales bacterium]|nr:homoserine dehydrogenase [Candidatus Acidoferrales bacterium]
MDCKIGIGLLGCGTVGASVAQRLLSERDAIERRAGVRYELQAIAIANPSKARHASLDPALFTTDARAVIDDPRVDLIVEAIGGTQVASELLEYALERGRTVVTANKDLIATQGPRLFALAHSRGARLRYEAASCGAIPVIRVLDDALAGDRVQAFGGVVNGTCTYILSQMERGEEYEVALARAQELGFAEVDPSSDVEGLDATHKLALLMQLAFQMAVISPRLRRSGITGVTKRDVARAHMLGYRIRLVAAATRNGSAARGEVAPVLVPEAHPFAAASGPENVVRIFSRDAGPLLLSGVGAGGFPTASSVLGDVVTALRDIANQRAVHYPALDPALDIEPLFADLPRHPELPRYPLWDDSILESERNLNLNECHARSFDTVFRHARDSRGA